MIGPYFACFIPRAAALGEEVRPRAAPFSQGSPHDFFGMAQAVDSGGVDPVDAQFEGFMNGGDGFLVVLRSPRKLPTATAGGPGAKADGCNLQV